MQLNPVVGYWTRWIAAHSVAVNAEGQFHRM